MSNPTKPATLDEFTKAGFDHPCKQTCSGWQQGHDRGFTAAQSEIGERVFENIKALFKRYYSWIDLINEMPEGESPPSEDFSVWLESKKSEILGVKE